MASGLKSQFRYQLNWVSSDPAPFVPNVPPSGVLTGAMASTNTIYTQIVDLSNYDNTGLEITWTGTPTGTISILCSISGVKFYPLTFSPALAQPADNASGYLIDLNQLPFKYLFVQYVNSSSTGTLSTWLCAKDLS